MWRPYFSVGARDGTTQRHLLYIETQVTEKSALDDRLATINCVVGETGVARVWGQAMRIES